MSNVPKLELKLCSLFEFTQVGTCLVWQEWEVPCSDLPYREPAGKSVVN